MMLLGCKTIFSNGIGAFLTDGEEYNRAFGIVTEDEAQQDAFLETR
jgi:hypothetical protein